MTTISAGDLAILRTQQHTTELRVSVFAPSTLWTGRVNNASIARGARSIAFDGGSGATTYIRSYQELWAGTAAGLYDVGRVRIKTFTGSPTGTITVDENGIVWQDNLYLTIKHFYPIERIPPRIASGVFYKFFDLAYSDQNTKPPPVCIAGPDRIAEIVTAGTVTVNFDLTGSYAVAQGATISSYALSVAPATGVTVTFNTGTGLGDIEFSAAGQWWVTASCTDSNTKTQERFIAVKVENMATGGTYLKAQAGNVRETWGGGAIASIEAYGNVALSDFPDRAIVYLWHKSEFDGLEDYVSVLGADSQNVLMVGYLRGESITENPGDGTHNVSFTIQTPDGFLGNLPMRSIGLDAKASPSAWWHYAEWLTIGRAIHHLFKWHSTLLERHDFLGLTANTQRDITIKWPEGTMFQMANTIAWDTAILAKVTCDGAGRVHLVQDSQMLNTAGRAALDTVMEITDNDANGEVTISRSTEEKANACQVSGFYYPSIGQNTPYVSLMPGYRESSISYGLPAQFGSSPIDKPNQLLTSQTDSNEKCGRIFATENREIVEVRIPFKGFYTGALSVIPSVGWYEYGLTAASRKSLAGVLMLCRSIETQISQETGAFITSGIFEPEASGPDGIQGNYPSSMPTPPPPPEPRWEVGEGLPAYVVFSSIFYREDVDADWTTVDSGNAHTGGNIDPWWKQKQLSSNPKNAIIGGHGNNGLVTKTITTTGETVNVAPAVSPANTWSDAAAPTYDVIDYIQKLSSPWTQDLVFALGKWQNASNEWRGWLAYSITGGDNWTWVNLYDGVTLPDEIKPIWMAVNGTYLLVTVWATGTGGGNDGLKLLVFDVNNMSYTTEYTLGDCTAAQRDSKTYYAFPAVVYDDNGRVYVAGRMASPQSLASPEHIIYTDDSFVTFYSLEKTWGPDICASLEVGLNDGSTNREYYAGKQKV